MKIKLKIPLEEIETYNEDNGEFDLIIPKIFEMEHSIVSICKWEAITHKHFLDNSSLSNDDMKLYLKCMSTPPIDDLYLSLISDDDVLEIQKYIDDSHSAYVNKKSKHKNNGDHSMCSEEIIAQMIMLNIPFSEFKHWHATRLLNLISAVNDLNAKANGGGKSKRINDRGKLADRAALNNKRLAESNKLRKE